MTKNRDDAAPLTSDDGIVPEGGHPAWKPTYKAERGASALHAQAYRARAGMIGKLGLCICTWPLEVDPATKHGHSKFCPAEMSA